MTIMPHAVGWRTFEPEQLFALIQERSCDVKMG